MSLLRKLFSAGILLQAFLSCAHGAEPKVKDPLISKLDAEEWGDIIKIDSIPSELQGNVVIVGKLRRVVDPKNAAKSEMADVRLGSPAFGDFIYERRMVIDGSEYSIDEIVTASLPMDEKGGKITVIDMSSNAGTIEVIGFTPRLHTTRDTYQLNVMKSGEIVIQYNILYPNQGDASLKGSTKSKN